MATAMHFSRRYGASCARADIFCTPISVHAPSCNRGAISCWHPACGPSSSRTSRKGVVAALDADDEAKRDLIRTLVARPLLRMFSQFAALRGTFRYDPAQRRADLSRIRVAERLAERLSQAAPQIMRRFLVAAEITGSVREAVSAVEAPESSARRDNDRCRCRIDRLTPPRSAIRPCAIASPVRCRGRRSGLVLEDRRRSTRELDLLFEQPNALRQNAHFGVMCRVAAGLRIWPCCDVGSSLGDDLYNAYASRRRQVAESQIAGRIDPGVDIRMRVLQRARAEDYPRQRRR